MKQILSIEQMQHLQELGLELKETMLYWARCVDNNPSAATHYGKWVLIKGNNAPTVGFMYWEFIPAYTLQDVLDALPRFVIDEEGNKYYLQIEMMNTEFDDWRVSYKSVGQDESPLGYFQAFNLIDAAVRMLVLCYEEGYVETNKNE